jgi:hypothetical protein
MGMGVWFFHHPLQASLCELRPDKSLEAQSSRRKSVFLRTGDDARRKEPRRLAVIVWLIYLRTIALCLNLLCCVPAGKWSFVGSSSPDPTKKHYLCALGASVVNLILNLH